jgi:hypothetical protein
MLVLRDEGKQVIQADALRLQERVVLCVLLEGLLRPRPAFAKTNRNGRRCLF